MKHTFCSSSFILLLANFFHGCQKYMMDLHKLKNYKYYTHNIRKKLLLKYRLFS